MSAHACHAAGCRMRVQPEMFMCGPHWRMVPDELKRALLAAYRPGQERLDPRPSQAYITAAKRVANAVAGREGRRIPYPQVEPATRPGELDPVIQAALDVGGRALTHAERIQVDGRHATTATPARPAPGAGSRSGPAPRAARPGSTWSPVSGPASPPSPRPRPPGNAGGATDRSPSPRTRPGRLAARTAPCVIPVRSRATFSGVCDGR